MFKKIDILLNNPIYFKYGFFILLIFSILLNGVFFVNLSNFYLLYIFSSIFLGIGFYNKSTWFLTIFVVLVAICRFFLIPDSNLCVVTFISYLITYCLITFIAAGLMKYLQKTKQEKIELITTLTNALESRNPYTMHHSENVAKYAVLIAEKMNLSKELCNNIRLGGLLHDIGKIGIPEHILTKPGKLTDEEFKIIKKHPTIGFKMIKHVRSFSNNGVLDIVLYHHERFDGKGYPAGLKGNEIPLLARIVAVADTFDAMTSKRVYRNEFDLGDTLNEIRKNKGTQFDPKIADVFLSLFNDKKINIKAEYEERNIIGLQNKIAHNKNVDRKNSSITS